MRVGIGITVVACVLLAPAAAVADPPSPQGPGPVVPGYCTHKLDTSCAIRVVMPRLWKNCTNVNRRYPHGVGRVGARDKETSGTPVTNFRRSNRLYRIAMSYNKGLDRDKDFIACEKH